MEVGVIVALVLAIVVPCVTAIIGMLVNRHDMLAFRADVNSNFTDVKNQINHLIDLHINHAERIRALEVKAEGKPGEKK